MGRKTRGGVLGRGLTLALALLCSVDASINFYNQEELRDNFLLYRKSAMVASERDSGLRSAIEVQLDFLFPRSGLEEVSGGSGLVQVSVIPQDQFQYIGATDPEHGTVFCCSDALASKGGVCNAPGRIIFDSKASGIKTWDVVASKSPDGLDSVTRLSSHYEVREPGYHYLVISYCSGASSTVRVNGLTRWVNPHGYLPAEVFGWLPFLSYLSMSYLFLAAGWAFACFKQDGPLGPLQQWCTALVALGALDSYLRYMDFYHFNVAGTRGSWFMLSASFFLCLKNAIMRMVMLAVASGTLSNGNNVSGKTSLFDAGVKVSCFGAIYLLASAAQLAIENLDSAPSLLTGFVFAIPLVLLDFVCCVWISRGLDARVSDLKAGHGAREQLTWYTRLRVLWRVFVVVTLCWGVIFTYGVFHDWIDQYWATFYKFGAFYEAESFLFLATLLMTLWAPRSHTYVASDSKADYSIIAKNQL